MARVIETKENKGSEQSEREHAGAHWGWAGAATGLRYIQDEIPESREGGMLLPLELSVHPRANYWIFVCHPAHIQNENPNSILVFFSSLCYNFKCSIMHGTQLQHPRRFETESSTGNLYFCPGVPDLAIAMQAIVIKQKHISSHYHTPSTWSLPFKWVFNEGF